MSNSFVKIELQITQYVLKEDVRNYDEFVEVFEDVEPYFIEDSFEHLNINSVSTNFKVGKCEEQDQYYCRKLDGEISFSVDSIEELKEFLEEEYVLDEGEFDGNRFVLYYTGDIDAVNVGEDEQGDFVSVDIDGSEINGSISFSN